MSLTACAARVEQGDPARFRAAMAAPVDARRVLFPLYALNVEVARAPWVTQEPMIAEMRLQWWRDALEEIGAGGPVRRHEIVDALANILDPMGAKELDRLVAARRWDVYTDAFEDQGHLEQYISDTSGALMWTAARLLGDADRATVEDFAFATGVANLLRAVPELQARGRKPLVDGTTQGVRVLVEEALMRHARAVSNRRKISASAAPALLSGWLAKPTLSKAQRTPETVIDGLPEVSPFRLPRVAMTGWWR